MKTLKDFFFRLKQKQELLAQQETGIKMSDEDRTKLIAGVKAGKAFKIKDKDGNVIYSYPEDHISKKS